MIKIFIFISFWLSFSQLVIAQDACKPKRPKFSIGSDLKNKTAKRAEIKEISEQFNRLMKTKEFNKIYGYLLEVCPCIKIRIVYGDSSKTTGTSAAGGTFVPKFNNPKAKGKKKGFQGGTLVIDKDNLTKQRPKHKYQTFMPEVMAHELYHAAEACSGQDGFDESEARERGEEAAKELREPTVAETNPVFDKKKPVKKHIHHHHGVKKIKKIKKHVGKAVGKSRFRGRVVKVQPKPRKPLKKKKDDD